MSEAYHLAIFDTPCRECGKPLGPEVLLGDTCGKCRREVHPQLTSRKAPSAKRDQPELREAEIAAERLTAVQGQVRNNALRFPHG